MKYLVTVEQTSSITYEVEAASKEDAMRVWREEGGEEVQRETSLESVTEIEQA